MAGKARPRDDFDGPWKEILEARFREFLAFCAEDVHSAIDWSKENVFLKQELAALVPAEAGRKGVVDLLAQVHLASGAGARVLCHIEAQAQRTRDLERRLFRDHTRLVESKQTAVFTLALLLDHSPTWNPTTYDDRLFGTGCLFQFRSVKLADWLGKEDDLVASANPFARVVLTWLELQQARSGEDRLESKTRLVRGLFDRGLEHDVVRDLLRFIGWIVKLPKPLEERFEATIREEIRQMTGLREGVYMLPWERDGFERGIKQGRQEGREEGRIQEGRAAVIRFLTARFGNVPETIRMQIERIEDSERLDRLIDAAALAADLAAFARILAEPAGG